MSCTNLDGYNPGLGSLFDSPDGGIRGEETEARGVIGGHIQ